MAEVTGPVIAIVFVLCAVFVPVAFLGGIAGQLYKQFALTISVSVIISGIVVPDLSFSDNRFNICCFNLNWISSSLNCLNSNESTGT